MTDYKLSVVVLVYNTEQYLRECFDSLVNQTLNDIEIIIVNDESPDNSLFIIEEYQSNYSNIKVINQKNSGGAVAGNNGVMHASGEYVTIMDSDDVVPLNAYEKMYNKASETNADIVIGNAKLLVNGQLKELVYKKERDVWEKERTVTDLSEFPDIFYDGFYWNKIYKRQFLVSNDCLMPPGMLYADRPMVNKAYLFADKIEIITDTVYFWRKREDSATQKSITQLKNDIKNFNDRMESLHYQINYFNDFGNEELKTEFLKRNVERLLFPIRGILESEEFKWIYLKEVKAIFKTIPNIFDNDLGITKDLYIYMILHDLTEELVYYLENNPNGKIIEEDGVYYWALPYFRDPEKNFPDSLFKIKVLLNRFIQLDGIYIDNERLVVQNLTVPKIFKVQSVKLVFQSRKNASDSQEFPLIFRNNGFSLDVKLPEFSFNTTYDLHLLFQYDGKQDKFRVEKDMLTNKDDFPQHKNCTFYFTKNNFLSLVCKDIEIEHICFDKEKIELLLNDMKNEESIEFFIRNRINKESIYFVNKHRKQFELKWDHFLDPNNTYDFFYKISGKSFRLSTNDIKEIKNVIHKYGSINILPYSTDKNNFSIETFSNFRYKIKRLKSIF